MDKIAIFREDIFPAGGIETWIFNLATLYHKTHDITVYYSTIAPQQKKRLGKLVKLREYTGQDIEVDRAIFCFDMLGFNTVKAKHKIYVIHADYSKIYNPAWTVDADLEIYAVSKVAQRGAKSRFPFREIGLLYNPVLPETKPKHYNIVSVTRLSEEKGLWRMKKLAAALDRAKVSYTWHIYAPFVKDGIDSPNVVFHPPTMNAPAKVKNADFLVQLSDTESFGYSMVEAMVMNTGLIVTGIPVLKELNINKNNAIIVPLKAKADWRHDRIVKKILQFRVEGSYQPPKSDQEILLGKPSREAVDYNPTLLKNILDFDVQIKQTGEWVLGKSLVIIEDKELAKELLKEKYFKEIK